VRERAEHGQSWRSCLGQIVIDEAKGLFSLQDYGIKSDAVVG